MEIAPLAPTHASAWAELFDACTVSCFCRYWHFEGDKNAWLARCAHAPGVNRREHLAGLDAGDPTARGLLALDGPLAVGWMKLVPLGRLGKLTRLPVYRSLPLAADALPVGDDDAYAVGCLLVRPSHRRRGVARALVAAAESHVSRWGGKSVNAFPRHAEAPLHDEEAWMGPERLFAEAGYARVGGEGPYPVYRKVLGQ